MGLSSLPGSGVSGQERGSAVEYKAQATSPLLSGEVRMTVSDKALTMTALFDTAEIAFSEINALEHENYTIIIRADSGSYTLSRMGSWCQPFYDALNDAYNKAVLRALFIKGSPVLTAKGNYLYSEKNEKHGGSAAIHVYENSVVTLPPDLSARRVPLCFVSGMEKSDFELTLKMDTGDSYKYAKLGYDTEAFSDAVEKQIRALHERSVTAVKELDPALPATQVSQVAKIMPYGAAAQIGTINSIAPSFAAALEKKLYNTRAAESYQVFKELCAPSKIYVGFRKNEVISGSDDGMPGKRADSLSLNAVSSKTGMIAPPGKEESETAQTDAIMLWLIAPSSDGQFAAVEFAESDSATFVYRTDGDFPDFARQLNRALEAIDFKREVIRLSDEELWKPENADYFMAVKRTAALRFIRSNFCGRVIHSGAENWKRRLTELWRADT